MMRAAIWLGFAVFAATGLTALCGDAQAQTAAATRSEASNTVKLPAVLPPAILPPDVAFGRFIALIRGHLLTGDELVRQRDWEDAHRHFMFPLEEIYGVIRENLRDYHTPPFDGALKALARTVAAHNAKQYPKAREKVESALAAADADLKLRQPIGHASWCKPQSRCSIPRQRNTRTLSAMTASCIRLAIKPRAASSCRRTGCSKA